MADVSYSYEVYFAIWLVVMSAMPQHSTPSLPNVLMKVAFKESQNPACDGAPNNNMAIWKNTRVPHTCADIHRDDPEARDGEYWLFPKAPQFHGGRVKLYCVIKSTEQLEYLTLPNKNYGVYPNKQTGDCRRETPIRNEQHQPRIGTTHFLKIRIYPSTMSVNRFDLTFKRGTRKQPQQYGVAEDCYSRIPGCRAVGTFLINTQDTGMKFLSVKWVEKGYKARSPVIKVKANGSIILVTCGGFCGGCKPMDPMILHPDNL